MNPVVALMIPTRGTIFTKAIMAALREVSAYDYAVFTTTDLPIPDCRNALVEQAEQSGIPFTHYLMIDDDVVIPQDGLAKMLALDAEVVLIDYPTHWMSDEGRNTGNIAYSDDQKTEVLWGGLGCTLVKAEVFSKLEKPYFIPGGRRFNLLKGGKKQLMERRDYAEGGEDFEFYDACRKLGYKLRQVEGLVAGHAKIMHHVGVLEKGKYIKQHDVHIADVIERPLK